MSLEQFASLAEIVAAIAVVASLLYLGVQIQHSNKQGRASARYSFVQAMGEVNLSIAQAKSTASVFRRGIDSPEALDDDEKMQFWMLIGQYSNTWSAMYELHRDGMLPESHWCVVRKDMFSVFSSKGGMNFWKSFGAHGFDRSFVDFVDTLLEKGEQTYDLLAEW